MNTTELTKVQKTLLYGLKKFKVPKEDAVAIVAFVEEDDQVLLIHYMKTHSNAISKDLPYPQGSFSSHFR